MIPLFYSCKSCVENLLDNSRFPNMTIWWTYSFLSVVVGTVTYTVRSVNHEGCNPNHYLETVLGEQILSSSIFYKVIEEIQIVSTKNMY